MSHQIQQQQQISRRMALRVGGGIAALSGIAATLAACGSDQRPQAADDAGAATLGDFVYQLAWIRNAQFAGEYIADQRGYYLDEGFSAVELLTGGPNVSVNNIVTAKQALITLTGPDVTGPAILEGAPLVALGAIRQKNPLCIMSLADHPIHTPQDMVGKRIGLQAINETTWWAFLEANGLQEADITTVPVQFDPQPLVVGDIDGHFSNFANEPNSLRVRGIEVATMLLADHGLPLATDIIVARTDSVQQERDALKAAIRGTIRGWRDAIAEPEYGAQLAVDNYGRDLGLDLTEQTMAVRDHLSLIVTEDTKTNGLFTVTDQLLEQSLQSLARGGIELTAKQLYDLSLLTEIYDEDPSLREGV